MIKSYICDHCGEEFKPNDLRILHLEIGQFHLCSKCGDEYRELDRKLSQKLTELKTSCNEERFNFLSTYRWLKKMEENKK